MGPLQALGRSAVVVLWWVLCFCVYLVPLAFCTPFDILQSIVSQA